LKTNKPKIYKSCKTLSLFRFYEILDSKDYKYLIHDWEDVVIDEDLQKELDEIWGEIFKEYITLKDDGEIKASFKQLAFISKLTTKLVICSALLDGYVCQSTKKGRKVYSDELREWGYKIDPTKPLQNQVDRIISQLKTLKSTIEIKEKEHDKQFKKELTEEKITIDEQIANVEEWLGKDHIDPEKTVVARWIAYVKRVQQKVKKQKAA